MFKLLGKISKKYHHRELSRCVRYKDRGVSHVKFKGMGSSSKGIATSCTLYTTTLTIG